MKLLSLLLLLPLAFPAKAQTTEKQNAIKTLVESKTFRFQPQTANPMNGRVIQLNADFDLTIRPDTLISYLPYYGRAYVAPIDPSQSPLQFTSKSFSYTAVPRKKNGWNITIKPTDYREIQLINMSVSTDGYTTVQVISTNREQISFYGIIMPVKSKS